MIIVIDNYDSFTYNLVQYLGQLGADLEVYRNDKITVDEIKEKSPERILISPGPGRPDEAGITEDVIREFAGKVPILGVCLGHQAIAEVYGASIVRGSRIMHGKVSQVSHNGKGIFKGVPSPFQATRYHSLVVDPATVKDPLVVTARAERDDEIMGIVHRELPVFGVQFHPESILTDEGMNILRNFLKV